MEAGAAVLNESVIYLPQVGSTNAWAKENIAQFGPVGAVYTTDQAAGRGRLQNGSGTAVHAAVVRVLGCLRRIKAALWH